MKITFLFAFFFLLLANAFAQQAGKISGTILQSGKPADGATVSLLRAKDSAILKLTSVNKEGVYLFENVADGKYLLSVTAVGHRKSFSKPIEITPQQPTVQLTAIRLNPIAKAMTDVTVTAKRPLIEQRIDRTILNVDASITNIGASALEVL